MTSILKIFAQCITLMLVLTHTATAETLGQRILALKPSFDIFGILILGIIFIIGTTGFLKGLYIMRLSPEIYLQKGYEMNQLSLGILYFIVSGLAFSIDAVVLITQGTFLGVTATSPTDTFGSI